MSRDAGLERVDLNQLALPELYRQLAETGLVRRLLELARDEDLGPLDSPWRGRARVDPHPSPAEGDGRWASGDITTAACIRPEQKGEASLVTRQAGVVSGLECMPDLLELFAPGASFEALVADGQEVAAGTVLGVLRGPLDEILELERTMLNLISRLCGVATQTAMYLGQMTRGGAVKAGLYDTRKTTPGMRVLEKYAVRCGGGFSHRMGLYDAVLIKDNHLAGVTVQELPAFVAKAAGAARGAGAAHAPSFIEVEVDSLEQLRALLTLPAGTLDIVLLDNMTAQQMRVAVGLRDESRRGLLLEASGGVNFATIRETAETGVDRISVGALTHQAVAMDIGLDIVAQA
jgi:nicotinate-nucleotide pyrophosphorylase (carboxylating)